VSAAPGTVTTPGPSNVDGEPDEARSPAEQAWRRGKMRSGLTMVPVGVFLLGAGAWLAVGPEGMTGYAVGAAGVFLIVLGSLFVKFAVAGPVPASVRRQS